MNKATSFFLVGALTGCVLSSMIFVAVSRNSSLAGRSGSDGQPVRELKFAHALAVNHPVHLAIVQMAENVHELSAGKLSITVFPSGQLGNETECLEQIQRGTLAMTKTSAAPLGNFVSRMKVFSLPYIFNDRDHFWRVLDGEVGKDLLEKLGLRDDGQPSGFHGICFFDAGSRNFYSERPIQTPADLEGLNIRVMQDPVAIDMIDAMGGEPAPIPFGELYTALKQGVVDGAENNPPSILTNKHNEVCSHLTLDHHSRIPDVVIFSSQVWDTLSAQEQQWISQAAEDASVFQRGEWSKSSNKALDDLRGEGMEVHEVELQPFRDASQPVLDKYATGVVGDVLKRIQAEQ